MDLSFPRKGQPPTIEDHCRHRLLLAVVGQRSRCVQILFALSHLRLTVFASPVLQSPTTSPTFSTRSASRPRPSRPCTTVSSRSSTWSSPSPPPCSATRSVEGRSSSGPIRACSSRSSSGPSVPPSTTRTPRTRLLDVPSSASSSSSSESHVVWTSSSQSETDASRPFSPASLTTSPTARLSCPTQLKSLRQKFDPRCSRSSTLSSRPPSSSTVSAPFESGYARSLLTLSRIPSSEYVNPIALDAINWKYYLVFVIFLAFELVYIYFFLVETKVNLPQFPFQLPNRCGLNSVILPFSFRTELSRRLLPYSTERTPSQRSPATRSLTRPTAVLLLPTRPKSPRRAALRSSTSSTRRFERPHHPTLCPLHPVFCPKVVSSVPPLVYYGLYSSRFTCPILVERPLSFLVVPLTTMHALANTSSLRLPVTLAASLGQTSRDIRTTKDHADVALARLGSLWERKGKKGQLVGRQKRVIWRRETHGPKRPKKPPCSSVPRPASPPIALPTPSPALFSLSSTATPLPVCLVKMKTDNAAHFFFQYPLYRQSHASHPAPLALSLLDVYACPLACSLPSLRGLRQNVCQTNVSSLDRLAVRPSRTR